MNVYDSIMNSLRHGDIDFHCSSQSNIDQTIQCLSLAPHDDSIEPHLMFAFDRIQYEKEKKAWIHVLKIELYTIASVRGMKEIPALVELEADLTADLLKRDLGEDYRTPNSWSISDMFLYFPKYALSRILGLGQQRVCLLQRILDINIPNRAENVTESDFFNAFCLGNYIPSQLEGVVNYFLTSTVFQGMEIPELDEDESVPTFFNEITASHEFKELDFWHRDLTPTEIMNFIASFYNSFMQYRDLLFVKKKLESIVYDVTNYATLVQFCKE